MNKNKKKKIYFYEGMPEKGISHLMAQEAIESNLFHIDMMENGKTFRYFLGMKEINRNSASGTVKYFYSVIGIEKIEERRLT